MRLRYIPRIISCLCTFITLSGVVNAGNEVNLGVFPYVTPVQLVKFHNPLRQRLQDTLGRPVTLVTAPSFKSTPVISPIEVRGTT